MKRQATRIEPPQPDPTISEPAGCLGALALFICAVGAVYACPFVIGWAMGLYP